LFAEYDATEVAAAAASLLERATAAAKIAATTALPARPAAPEVGSGSAAASGGDFVRVFMTVGERDGVRTGDLVGALTGEAGITSDRIGKIEMRETHTLVEIAAADADSVIEKITGKSVRGRRIVARRER